jgi:hypothetical protein
MIQNHNKNNFLFLIGFICLLFFTSACNNRKLNKLNFLSDFNKLISYACEQKTPTHFADWDDSDRKLRNLLNENYKFLYCEFTEEEKKEIWKKSFGYTYLRYGNELMKKFGEADFLLIKITDSVNYYHKDSDLISRQIHRDCLHNLEKPEPEIRTDLKKILKKRKITK